MQAGARSASSCLPIWCAEMRRADPIASPTLWVAVLFVALLFGMPQLAPLFQWSFPGVTPPVFERGSFFALWLSHAGLVLVAGGAATLIGIALAIFVTRPAGRDFRALISTLGAVGQTFPPAAVLALAVPARGFGLSAWQLLRDVDLPLAAPVILAGVRVSVTIAIGTATIGSTVGALTLGTPIFDGLAGNKLPFVIQGAVLVALFAILTDMLFARLERWLQPPGAQPVV